MWVLLTLSVCFSVQAAHSAEVGVLSECSFPGVLFAGKNSWQNAPVFDNENNVKAIKEVWTIQEDKLSIKVQQFNKRERAHFFKAAGYDTNSDPVKEYYLHCHSNPSGQENQVIVQKADGASLTYLCLKFVQRSEVVLSFAKSMEKSEVDKNLCSSELFDSPSPLLYYETSYGSQRLEEFLIGKPYMVCPMEGEFDIESIYSTRSGKECPGKYGDNRFLHRSIENECERGSGFLANWPLHGPNDTCESMGMSMYCLASWKDSKFTFMLMTDRSGLHSGVAYCGRYLGHGAAPSDNKLYLSNSSVCDNTDDLQLTRSYVRYDLTRQTDNEGNDLCSDDSKECKDITAEECESNLKYTCSESCDFCPTPRPWAEAKIADRFHGKFTRDSFMRGKEKVTIEEGFINVPQMGKYEVLAENVCKFDEDYGSFSNVTTYLLIGRGNDKGCAPHTVAMAIKEITPSVILYKISQGVNTHTSFAYPRNDIKKPGDWDMATSCSMLFFHSDHFRPLLNVFHYTETAWDVLIKPQASTSQTACAQLLDSVVSFTLPTGEECQGNIKPGQANTTFDFHLEECSQDDAGVTKGLEGKTISYECLAVLHGKDAVDGDLVITQATGDVNILGDRKYLCWALSEKDPLGYWLPVSNCYPHLWDAIRFSRFKPLGTLHNASNDKTSTAWLLLLTIALLGQNIAVFT